MRADRSGGSRTVSVFMPKGASPIERSGTIVGIKFHQIEPVPVIPFLIVELVGRPEFASKLAAADLAA
jgi:hypothetical protein